MARRGPPTSDTAESTSRFSTFTRRPASALKCSSPTARLRRSEDAALVGFGGRAGAVSRQKARLLARSRRVTLHFDTPWGPLWEPREVHERISHIDRYVNPGIWRRGSQPKGTGKATVFSI
jgi:hypothetical protein